MDLAALGTLPGVIEARAENTHVLLSASAVHLAVPALLSTLASAGAPLAHLTTHSATLEDVFVKLTGRHLRDA
jgi:ABC-2 type transport system ATP-binding protein